MMKKKKKKKNLHEILTMVVTVMYYLFNLRKCAVDIDKLMIFVISKIVAGSFFTQS